jgi:hypothetical protein
MISARRARWSASAAAGLALALVAPAWAEPEAGAVDAAATPSLLTDVLGLSGSLRGAYFSKDKSFSDDTGYAIGSLWLTARPQDFLGLRSYFDARVQGQDLGRSSDVTADLREGYLERSFGALDVRAGRQVVIWGRADKINPTDSWTTRDYTLLTPNDEDQRLGVTTLQATWNAGAYRLIGLWQPEWRYPELPAPPLPAGVTTVDIAPEHRAQQGGVKLDHSGEGADWSLSYAHSADRVPDLAVLSASPSGVVLGLLHQELDTFGADAALPIGNYGLRGEVAYTRTVDHDGADPRTKNSNVFAVLGAERTFAGVLNVNLQYLYRHTLDFQDPSAIADPNTRQLAQQVNLLSNQLAPDMHGASLRINHKAFNETLETEITGVTWFEKGDAALRPKITYAFNDRVKGIVGGEIYRGPADSFFGRLEDVTTAYAEVQIGF